MYWKLFVFWSNDCIINWTEVARQSNVEDCQRNSKGKWNRYDELRNSKFIGSTAGAGDGKIE